MDRRLLEKAPVLAEAAIGLAAASVIVHLSPAPFTRWLLLRPARRRAPSLAPGRRSANDIAWAISAIGRRVPRGASCFVQALSARALLRRHGFECRVRIGVRKDPAGLRAHAWVEQDGKVILGAVDDLDTYASFEGGAW